MSKAFVCGFAIGLALLAVVGVGASRRQRVLQRDAKEQKARAELAQYNEEIVDATPVQLGVLTERQRLHGRLYPYLPTTNKIIADLIANAGGRILGIEVSGQGQALIEPQTPESYFGELVRTSDAVIHGKPTWRISQITEDGAFIFTDYDIVLTEVLKDNRHKPLTSGNTITVTRPGGKVVVNGIIVKAHDRGFDPIPLNQPILLFLRYIPETDAYQATRAAGTFEIDGSSIRPLAGNTFPPGVLRDGVSSLQIVRAISSR